MVLRPSRKTGSSRPPENTPYNPTERERAVARKLVDRQAEAAPRLKITKCGEGAALSTNHPHADIGYALLMEALGTSDRDFLDRFLSQLASAGSQGAEPDEGAINFMLSVIKGIGPRDQIEAMLGAHIAAVHMATMRSARRLACVDDIAQQDSAERTFNKCARTFTSQIETLKRYRADSEQQVTVQHVTVGQGGQAIVGNVNQSQANGAPQQGAASPALLTDAKLAPMPIIEEDSKRAAAPLPRTKAMKSG